MPRSIALWMTLREVSRSVRWPKLLQPSPTAETRRPEPPRLRICMDNPVRWGSARRESIVTRERPCRKAALLRRAQMPGRGAIPAGTQRTVELGICRIVAMTNQVGDRRIAEHASAVRQGRATETQYLPVRQLDVDRRGIARSHHLGAPRDEGAQLILRQFKGAGVAAMIHKRDERRFAVGLFVRQRKIMAKSAVDEFRAGI